MREMEQVMLRRKIKLTTQTSHSRGAVWGQKFDAN